MKETEKGVVHILIIFVIIALIIGLGAYFFLSKGNFSGGLPQQGLGEPSQVQGEVPISDSDAIEDIEKELETTDFGDLEKDLDSLDAEAAPL